MARKKPRFACQKCGDMGSACASAKHFKEHPSHRTERQQKDFESNQLLREKKKKGVGRKAYKRRKPAGLPTVRRSSRMKVVRVMKHCTDCGYERKATYTYCGGCGIKLTG